MISTLSFTHSCLFFVVVTLWFCGQPKSILKLSCVDYAWSPCVCICFLQVFQFSATVQKHVCPCGFDTVQDVFPAFTLCALDELQQTPSTLLLYKAGWILTSYDVIWRKRKKDTERFSQFLCLLLNRAVFAQYFKPFVKWFTGVRMCPNKDISSKITEKATKKLNVRWWHWWY